MTIHIVAPGQTLNGIAREYGVAPGLIARYNGLTAPYALAVGQSLLILRPVRTYTVQQGDTLYAVAGRTGVSAMKLLQNNPNLGGRTSLYPGQVLVIELEDQPLRTIEVNGYAYPYVDRSVLWGILPYASWLTPFTYGIAADGGLVELEDAGLIQLAHQYQAGAWMHLSTLTETGGFSNERAAAVLESPARQEELADAVVARILQQGYDGLDVDFEYIYPENAAAYAEFVGLLRQRVNELGLPLITALAPKVSADQPGVLYEGHDYAAIGANSDAVLVMTYEWGYTYGPPLAVAPIASVRRVLDYAVSEIPPEKIFMGFPNYAYNWTLPYEAGRSRAQLISNGTAVQLAIRYGAEIQFDETAQTPYFYYTAENGSVHEVWFEDARSAEAKLRLVEEYGFRGVGYWNFMRPFVTGFSIQNVLYDVRKPG